MTKEEKTNLKRFLEYLQDKVEDCYSKETQNSINEYLNNIKEDKKADQDYIKEAAITKNKNS